MKIPVLLAVLALAAVPAYAAHDAEAQFQDAMRGIDEAQGATDEARIEALVKELGFPRSSVEEARSQSGDKGWGETAARLAMGAEMIKSNPASSDVNNAHRQVNEMRTAGKSWTEIARTMDGVQFERATQALQRVRENLAGAHHAAGSAAGGHDAYGSGSSAPPQETAAVQSELASAQQAIDAAAPKTADDAQYQALTDTFQVDRATVEKLRERYGSQWGEMTILLAMARQLSEMNPGAFKSTADALPKIQGLRDQGKQWNEIAHSIDPTFQLDRVARMVNDVKGRFQS
jgi:hypothetical protein